MKTKPRHQHAVRTSISMPPTLFDIATEDQKRSGFATFSDYLQALIRQRKQQHQTALVG